MIQNKMEHKNILKILEVYEEDKHFYLITEFAEGDTLKQYMLKHRVSEDEIISIMKVHHNIYLVNSIGCESCS